MKYSAAAHLRGELAAEAVAVASTVELRIGGIRLEEFFLPPQAEAPQVPPGGWEPQRAARGAGAAGGGRQGGRLQRFH